VNGDKEKCNDTKKNDSYRLWIGLCSMGILGFFEGPSIEDLLAKNNKALVCSGEKLLSLSSEQVDTLTEACSENDRNMLDGYVDCEVSRSCDKISKGCRFPKISTTCNRALDKQNKPYREENSVESMRALIEKGDNVSRCKKIPDIDIKTYTLPQLELMARGCSADDRQLLNFYTDCELDKSCRGIEQHCSLSYADLSLDCKAAIKQVNTAHGQHDCMLDGTCGDGTASGQL